MFFGRLLCLSMQESFECFQQSQLPAFAANFWPFRSQASSCSFVEPGKLSTRRFLIFPSTLFSEASASKSAGYVEDCVCLKTSRIQQLNGLSGWQDTQFDVTTPSLSLYFVHHWQSTRA